MKETIYKNRFFDILKKQKRVYNHICYNTVNQADNMRHDLQTKIQKNKD